MALSKRQKNSILVLTLGIAGGLSAVLLWRKYGGAKLKLSQPKLKSEPGVTLVDPCPGMDTIWDAPSQRCIPLVEEPDTYYG